MSIKKFPENQEFEYLKLLISQIHQSKLPSSKDQKEPVKPRKQYQLGKKQQRLYTSRTFSLLLDKQLANRQNKNFYHHYKMTRAHFLSCLFKFRYHM